MPDSPVTTPGLVTGESGMTLRQAVDKAGTLDQLAGLDSVALYRNAGKIVYNTLSERYQDVPLFPGDMLVVGQVVPLGRSDADPFANPFASPPADPRKEAPVREQADVWTTPSANREAFDDQTGSGGPATERAAVPLGTGSFPMTPATPTGTPPRIYSPPPRPDRIGAGTARLRPRQIERRSESEAAVQADDRAATASPDLTILAEAVAGGGDPGAAYRSLKGGRIYQPRFYLEAARILFAGQHAALGRRVLSNLVELRPGDYSALRGYAFWLAGFGQAADAEEVLGMLPNDGLLACMDLSSIRATHGDLAAAAAALSPPLVFVASGESGSLATIALTDFNALYHSLGKATPPHPIKRYPQNLAADIRIVLTSTGDADSLDFKVTEPGGFACSAGATPSPCGGRVSASGGVREYMIRHAVPGVYQISCVSDHAATIRAVIHTDWGRPQQTTRVITLLLDADMPRQVAEVEHAFQPHAP
jgi:hypothetical protein